jgi:hypothetical protein
VRANEFHENTDGTDDTSIAGRYRSGNTNISGLISLGELSARTVVQGNQGSSGYEFMRYGPGRPLSTIAANTVSSAMTVHGVAAGEDPALATMWAMLGHSNYSISVPTWVHVADVPDCLANGQMAARANSLFAKGNETATQASTLPSEAHLFEEVNELLEQWRSVRPPCPEQMTRVEHRMAADAYSLLDCLDNTQHDNKAPTVVLHGAAAGDLAMDFSCTAGDTDGTVSGYEWAFGDQDISYEPSPSHTYDDPGWYLVSCTVTDDDGVSTTDWQYFNFAPEPATAALLTLGGLAILRRRRRPPGR